MDTYESMRIFADSWGLLYMALVFVAVVIFTFRPGSRAVHDDIANIPFRHDDRPASDATKTAEPTGARDE